MSEGKKIIELGALAQPLKEQLAAAQIALPDATIEKLQKLADAISALSVHGLLSEAEVDRARNRFMKRLREEVAALFEGKPAETA